MPIFKDRQEHPLCSRFVIRKKTSIVFSKFVNRKTPLILLPLADKCKVIRHKPIKEKGTFFLSSFVVLLALLLTVAQPEHVADFIFAILPTAVEHLLKK